MLKLNRKLVIIFLLSSLIAAPALAAPGSLDNIIDLSTFQTQQLILFGLLALAVYDARSPIVKGSGTPVILEYFLRAVVGGLSAILAGLLSIEVSSGRVVNLYGSSLIWATQDQGISIFYLVWMLLACVYVGAVALMLFSERAQQGARRFGG